MTTNREYRAYCHYVHEDNSGPFNGDWRTSESDAERDRDSHNGAKHAGSSYARIEWRG